MLALAVGVAGVVLLVLMTLANAGGVMLTGAVGIAQAEAQAAAPGGQSGVSPGAVGEIPAAMLALYRRAASRYCPGLDWTVLAAVGWVETSHGLSTAPGVHSGTNFAGAAGPMQFLLSTWRGAGVDGDGDGDKDVYDPADAVPAAARYLCRAGAATDVRRALFAYNHATWYVDQVLAKAAAYALPPILIGEFSPGQSSGAWGGYSNGLIPAEALCPLPWAAGLRLRCDAAAALTKVDLAYRRVFRAHLAVTDAYRDLAGQNAVYEAKPGLAAIPGTSNHGWGLAVDLGGGMQRFGTPQYRWLTTSGPGAGWVNPGWAHDGRGREEPWHWEYIGGSGG